MTAAHLLRLVQCDGPRLVGANPPRLAPVVPLWKGAFRGPFLIAAIVIARQPLQQPLLPEGRPAGPEPPPAQHLPAALASVACQAGRYAVFTNGGAAPAAGDHVIE